MSKLAPHHKGSKVRPDWLRNPTTGRNLELDHYYPTLKLAIEYNGKHHYKRHRKYHKTKAAFEDQQARDKLKSELCAKAGIKLIVIPYTARGTMEAYLSSALKLS